MNKNPRKPVSPDEDPESIFRGSSSVDVPVETSSATISPTDYWDETVAGESAPER